MQFNEVSGRYCPNKLFLNRENAPFSYFFAGACENLPHHLGGFPRLPPITNTLLHTAGVMWRPRLSSQTSTTAWQSRLWHSLVTTSWQSRDNLRSLLRRDNLACHIRHRLVRRHTQPSPSGHAWNQAVALAQVFLRFKTIQVMFFLFQLICLITLSLTKL